MRDIVWKFGDGGSVSWPRATQCEKTEEELRRWFTMVWRVNVDCAMSAWN